MQKSVRVSLKFLGKNQNLNQFWRLEIFFLFKTPNSWLVKDIFIKLNSHVTVMNVCCWQIKKFLHATLGIFLTHFRGSHFKNSWTAHHTPNFSPNLVYQKWFIEGRNQLKRCLRKSTVKSERQTFSHKMKRETSLLGANDPFSCCKNFFATLLFMAQAVAIVHSRKLSFVFIAGSILSGIDDSEIKRKTTRW